MPQVLLQAVKQHARAARSAGVAVGLGSDQVPNAQVRFHAHMVRLNKPEGAAPPPRAAAAAVIAESCFVHDATGHRKSHEKVRLLKKDAAWRVSDRKKK